MCVKCYWFGTNGEKVRWVYFYIIYLKKCFLRSEVRENYSTNVTLCLETYCFKRGLVAQVAKNLWETWVWSLGREDPLEKGMATQSSILAWRIPGTEEPGRLQSVELQRVRHDWATNTLNTWGGQYIKKDVRRPSPSLQMSPGRTHFSYSSHSS